MKLETIFEKYYWLKTFLLSTSISLCALLLLFSLAGNSIGDVFTATLIIALLLGGIYTYLKHFSGKVATYENQRKTLKKELGREELKNQVENYKRLKITKSKRGQATLLIICILVLMVVLSLLNFIPTDYLYDLIIFIPLAYFIYTGRRWAIVLAMIIWTLNAIYKIFSLGGQGAILIVIIWWFFFITFYQALEVENERRKTINK